MSAPEFPELSDAWREAAKGGEATRLENLLPSQEQPAPLPPKLAMLCMLVGMTVVCFGVPAMFVYGLLRVWRGE